MKLDLKALRAKPGKRLSFAGEIPLDPSDFAEPVTLSQPLTAHGWAVLEEDDTVTVGVRFNVTLARACSRCLAEVPLALADADTVVLRGSQTPELLADAFNFVLGEPQIDLKPVLLSLVLSGFEPKPLCTPGCKGLCPSCGANLNETRCRCDKPTRKDARLAGLAKLLDP